MVPGSKESRIAEAVSARWPGAVLVLGHPFVDIWQAVKPERVGLRAWPDVPRGIDIKHGTLDALGWPHADQRDIAMGWKRILSTVRTYRDLEPALGVVMRMRAVRFAMSARSVPRPGRRRSRAGGSIGTQKERVPGRRE